MSWGKFSRQNVFIFSKDSFSTWYVSAALEKHTEIKISNRKFITKRLKIQSKTDFSFC